MTALASITNARARALLGETPCLTLVDANDPDVCLLVRLVRVVGADGGPAWRGLVDDRAALLDRVRMGAQPRFVMHPDAATSTVSGEIDIKVLGRAEGALVDAALAASAAGFGCDGAVVIEVMPRGMALEPLEQNVVTGAVPRT